MAKPSRDKSESALLNDSSMISRAHTQLFNSFQIGTAFELEGDKAGAHSENAKTETKRDGGRWREMGRANLLTCPSCDYKRRLTEAESLISFALVVACLKCGAAMQCISKTNAKSPGKQPSGAESSSLEALEEWVVS